MCTIWPGRKGALVIVIVVAHTGLDNPALQLRLVSIGHPPQVTTGVRPF